MLSKVLHRPGAGSVESFVFQQVSGFREFDRRSNGHELLDNPTNAGDIQALLDRIRALEAGIASERQAAYEQGSRDAEAMAEAQVQPVLQRLATSMAEVLTMRSDLRSQAENDVVQLALMISRRILHRELNVDESALAALARVVFERLNRSESYRVIVNPRFAAAIRAAVPPMQLSRVEIDQDSACAPGTLVIHSLEGTIDASIDVQLDEIGRGLVDRIERS